MKKIDVWLDLFSKNWKRYQIENMMTLFTDDVEYWETPFLKIKNKILLEQEWQIIKKHSDIEIEYAIFNEEWQKYSIVWDRKYKDKDWEQKHLRWIYLIGLNFEGKCDYFLQCTEKDNII